MRLLLTGATGFVGRNFLKHVVEKGLYEEIYLPLRNVQKWERQLTEDGLFGNRSLTVLKGEAPNWKFPTVSVDHVVHCAGHLFGREKESYWDCHVKGTANLFQHTRDVKRALLLSSLSAGGPCRGAEDAKTEKSIDQPLSWYGQSKLEMESMALIANYPFEVLALRPPIVLGPRDSATRPLYDMVKRPFWLKPGLTPKLLSFIAVQDLVECILHALWHKTSWLRLPHRFYYVGYPEPVTDREMLVTAGSYFGRKGLLRGKVIPLPNWLGLSH